MNFDKIPDQEDKIKLTPDLMEKGFDKMSSISAAMAQEINKEVGKNYINPEGHVKMSMWDKEFRSNDEEQIYQKKKIYSGFGDDGRMADWKKRFGLSEEGEIIKKQDDIRKKEKPALLESAATILFYKILKERFLIVKSSEWDDYENGADNLVIDKETGDVVGMFDEVGGEVTGEVKERGEKKDKQVKIIEKVLRGGSKIKYGLTYEKDQVTGEKKIVKKSFENIPVFYLALKLEDLGDLIDSVGENLNDGVKEKGLNIFDDFIKSLEAQAVLLQEKIVEENYKGDGRQRTSEVIKNIQNFQRSLEVMKSLREKF